MSMNNVLIIYNTEYPDLGFCRCAQSEAISLFYDEIATSSRIIGTPHNDIGNRVFQLFFSLFLQHGSI